MATESTTLEKILVVDDNVQNRLLVEGNLASSGYDVIQAASGEQALALFESAAPDLVLLDLLMPGIDGFETCKRMRLLKKGHDVPILFLTALSDLATHKMALNSGADDFLTKPINRTELLLRVRSLLRIKRLKDELRQRHDQIQSQHNALLRVQRQKEEFIGHLTHDLKSPLSTVVIGAQLVLRDAALQPKSRRHIQVIARAAETMNRLIHNMLDVGSLEDGALALRLAPVDIDGLLDEIAVLVSPRVIENQQTFTVARVAGSRTISADGEILRRILENLIDNAIKYTPKESAIAIEFRDGEAGTVEFVVKDNGPGIPESGRARIFEKYAQLQREGSHYRRQGTGLGLAFCRLAIELHGGRILVEENKPRGSVFRVILPHRHVDQASPAPGSIAPALVAPASAAPSAAPVSSRQES